MECVEYEEGYLSISIVLCEGTEESKYLAVYDTENFETDNDDYFERIFSIYKKIPHYMIEDKGNLKKSMNLIGLVVRQNVVVKY